MTKQILVAVDGSEEAADALQFAAEEWPDAALTALHVINPADSTTGAEGGFPGAIDQWYDSANERGERVLADAAADIDRDVDTRLEVGRPTTTILDVANADADDAEPFDHVVLASRGRTGLSRVVLGSVAEGVVRRATMPVTVVR
ncbi:MAG: universal stress protein UspA related nucleotide-binding protein [uncultured archaeon A07HR67]|nr:MAG: universal stress protein UspA related nucleotide-binding protein [uncultured archaeon A07HR67]